MKAVMHELENSLDFFMFIDEIHTIVGAGGASGSLDASNMFKPALARGEIQCIGATTLDEYRQYIEKDGALERRFQKGIVEPTSVDGFLQQVALGAGDAHGIALDAGLNLELAVLDHLDDLFRQFLLDADLDGQHLLGLVAAHRLQRTVVEALGALTLLLFHFRKKDILDLAELEFGIAITWYISSTSACVI